MLNVVQKIRVFQAKQGNKASCPIRRVKRTTVPAQLELLIDLKTWGFEGGKLLTLFQWGNTLMRVSAAVQFLSLFC